MIVSIVWLLLSPFTNFVHRLHPGLNMEFFIYVLDMHLDGAQGNAKAVANLFVEVAVGQQRQNFLLSLREFFHVGGRLSNFMKMINDFAGDFDGHGRATGPQLFDGRDQFCGHRFL